MTNRQARREQAKTLRPQRSGGAGRPPTGGRRPTRTPQSSGGSGTNLFSAPYLIGIGALVLVMIGILGFLMSRSGGGDEELVSALEAANATFPADLANGTKLGSDDAPIKLVAYEDFQCPFCLNYTAQDEPGIVDEYVKTGKVQLEFRHLPILGRESLQAAIASECAAKQNKFWQYHHKLFLTQAEAGQASDEQIDDGRFTDDNLRKFAGELGLDQGQFDTCFSSDEVLQKVNSDDAQAKQFGITGTPNFLLNGVPAGSDVGNMDNWRRFLNEQLDRIANATLTPAGSPTPILTITTTSTPTPGTATPAASASASAAASGTPRP